MTKTIIFDLGAVLIDWNPRYLYRKIFEKDEDMEWFLSNICTSEWNEEQDGGRSIQEATSLLIREHPEWEDEIVAFYSRWTEMLNGTIDGALDIFNTLRGDQRFSIYALTNWSAETWPIAWERFDFLKKFDGILVSGQENLKKPDPEIYKLLLSRFAIDPHTALFIDDNLRNIEAAISCQIPSIHFTGPSQLKDILSQTGVLKAT